MQKTPHKHAALIKAWAEGETVQSWFNGEWLDLSAEAVAWDSDMEVRLKPAIPPSISWSHVADEYNWLVADEEGIGYLYDNIPCHMHYGSGWKCASLHDLIFGAGAFKSFQSGSGGWRYLISCRPDPTGKREQQLKEYLDSLEYQEC